LEAEAILATETKCTATDTRKLALVHADETAHLLRSPKNAKRLLPLSAEQIDAAVSRKRSGNCGDS
jgi:hypothetical protein